MTGRRQRRAQRWDVVAMKRSATLPGPVPPEEDGDEYEPQDEGNAPDWRAVAEHAPEESRQ